MSELKWWDGVLPVLDFEATGVDPREARMVSAALILCTPKGYTLPGGVDVIVNPGVPIPAEAAKIHGITDARAQAEGIQPAEAVNEIVRCLHGVAALGWPLLIFNAPYDWPFLHAEIERHAPGLAPPDIPILDPLVFDRGFVPKRRGNRKLETLCGHYGVTLNNAHNAFADAMATAELLRAMARHFRELREVDFAQLQEVQADMHLAWVRDFNAYRARKWQDPIPETRWPGIEKTEAVHA